MEFCPVAFLSHQSALHSLLTKVILIKQVIVDVIVGNQRVLADIRRKQGLPIKGLEVHAVAFGLYFEGNEEV